MRTVLVVLTTFAVAWAWAALRVSGVAPGFSLVPVALSLALLFAGWNGAGLVPSRGPHVGRVAGLWSAVEVLALVVAVNVLQHLHRLDLMFPTTAIIVGLHFLPMARGIPVRLYYATGAGFLLAGLAGLLVPPAARPVVVGIGAALVLWATALVVVLRSRQLVAT